MSDKIDMHVARKICDLAEPRTSRARSMILGHLSDHPLMNKDRIESVIDAAELLPAALDRIEELEVLTPERPDFMIDLKKIETGEEVSAKKWLMAYRKAQNSNVVRQQMLDFEENAREGQAKRIAELEKALIKKQADLIESGGEPTRRRLSPDDEKDLYAFAREQLEKEGIL